jgi:hypothetical protein
MTRSIIPVAALAAVLLSPPVQANHGRSRPRLDTSDLAVTLRLNDDSYCPGGRMWGREGRVEGRDDRVHARVIVRHTERWRANLRGVRGQLICQDARGRVIARQSFTLDANRGRRGQTIERIVFRPPTQPGRYRVTARLGRYAQDSTTFLVAYDRDACPRRRHHDDDVVIRPRPRPRPRPIPPRPAPVPGSPLGRFLDVDLNIDRECRGHGPDRAQVVVRNTHQFFPIRVEGVRVTGLAGLSSFRRVGQGWGLVVPDVIAPGQSAVFEADGQIRRSGGRATASVTNHPSARGSARIKDCPSYSDEPGWYDLFH